MYVLSSPDYSRFSKIVLEYHYEFIAISIHQEQMIFYKCGLIKSFSVSRVHVEYIVPYLEKYNGLN